MALTMLDCFVEAEVWRDLAVSVAQDKGRLIIYQSPTWQVFMGTHENHMNIFIHKISRFTV